LIASGPGRPPNFRYIEVLVSAAGSATVRSNRFPVAAPVPSSGLAPFEAALAKSEYPVVTQEVALSCLDDCEEYLLETDGAAGYRYAARAGGFQEPGINFAVGLLEGLATR
jgi:hypothetical protein